MNPMRSVGTLVIGGGPAGLAPLLAASRDGALDALLQRGVAIVESGPSIGAGRLGRYAIDSDSSANTFLTAVLGHPDPAFAALADHPIARRIAERDQQAIPLPLAASFLDLMGDVMAGRIEAHPNGTILTGHTARSLRRGSDGRWIAQFLAADGRIVEIAASAVLLALGGTTDGHGAARVAGRELSTLGDRLVDSEHVLDATRLSELEARFSSVRRPRIVVIGGSTSAVSCLRVLLQTFGDALRPGALVLMHRHRLLPWYRSEADAHADGYAAFDAEDVCPISGMVHRFGGLRYASRDIVRGALGLGGLSLDPRLTLHQLGAPDDAARLQDSHRLLHEADLVVSALGYRPLRLPILDERSSPIRLMADEPGGPLVGPGAGILRANGRELGGLFGIGLAAGFRPDGAFGGEASFGGQVNGLWLWQNDVGRMIANQLQAAATAGALRRERLASGLVQGAGARRIVRKRTNGAGASGRAGSPSVSAGDQGPAGRPAMPPRTDRRHATSWGRLPIPDERRDA